MVGLPRKTLFIDRNSLGEQLRTSLKDAGIPFEFHDDIFDRRTTDAEWLSFVSKKRWAVVSGDKSLQRNFSFLTILRRTQAHVFILTELNHAPRPDRAKLIISAYAQILKLCHTNNGPKLWVTNPTKFVEVDFKAERGMLIRYRRFSTH